MKLQDKQRFRALAGDLSGLYGMRDYTFNEGRAKGMRAVQVDNGRGLSALLLADRCLDIPYFSYRGINLGLVLKPGLSAPWYHSEQEDRGFLKQFSGGLLTTCGMQNAGASCEADGRKYSLHGQLANTPGQCVNKSELVGPDGGISLQVSATMREACVFGEFLELHRQVTMETETNRIEIRDVVENCGFERQPLMNLYHFNFGYPLLDAQSKLYFSTSRVEPRDAAAQKGMNRYDQIEQPSPGCPEECFIHSGGEGAQFAMLENPDLGMAAVIHYDIDELPVFCQWKSMASGDYALGLEPSAAGFWGRKEAQERGLLRYLEPGQTQTYHLSVEVCDTPQRIQELKTLCGA